MSLRLCLVSAYFIWSSCTSSITSLQWHRASAALLELQHTERTDSPPHVFSKDFFLSFHWELCRKLKQNLHIFCRDLYKFLGCIELLYCIIRRQSKRTWCPFPSHLHNINLTTSVNCVHLPLKECSVFNHEVCAFPVSSMQVFCSHPKRSPA